MNKLVLYLIIFLALLMFSCQKAEINLSQFILHHTGKSVRIAILDTGLSPILQQTYESKIVYSLDVTTNSPLMSDQIGHGTAITALICNDYNKDIPISGIASEAELIIIKVFDRYGMSSDSYLSQATKIAVDQEADIINFSLGSYGDFPLTTMEIMKASERGILICASSGEYTNILSFPANHPNVISVSQEDAPHPLSVDFLIPCANTQSIAVIDDKIIIIDETGSSIACAIFTGVCAGIISSRNNEPRKGVIVNLIEQLKGKNFNQILLL